MNNNVNLTTRKNINFIKYFLDILIKNKMSLIILIFTLLGSFASTFLLIGKNPNIAFAKYSILFIGLPLLLLLAQVAILSIVLFSTTKGNNIDLYLYVQPVTKQKSVLLKQATIALLSLNVVIALFVSFVIELFFGVDVLRALFLLFIQILSAALLSFVWISLFATICIFGGQISSIIVTTLVAVIFMIGALIPALLSSNKIYTSDYDTEANQKTVARAMSIDNNGYLLESQNVILENTSAKNKVDLSHHSSFIDYSPLNLVFGVAPILSENIFSLSNQEISSLRSGDLDYSTIYLKSDIEDFANANHYQNMVLSLPGLKTVFDYNDKSLLFENMNDELQGNFNIKNHIKDNDYFNAILNILSTNSIWSVADVDDNVKSIIRTIAGIDSAQSLAYQAFDNYNLVRNKMDGFFDYLTKATCEKFSKLVEFIWTNGAAKDNIYSYQGFIASKEDVAKYHPSANSYDKYQTASPFDIAFIKNGLFHVQGDNQGNITNFQILNHNQIYTTIKSLDAVDVIDVLMYILKNDPRSASALQTLTNATHSIKTKADFDSFVDAFFKAGGNANNLIDIFEKIPGLKLRHETTMDINYFKTNNLLRITTDANAVITKIEYKDSTSTYQNLNEITKNIAAFNGQVNWKALNKTLNANLTTIDSWNKYIDDNNTVNNLEAIVKKIQSLSNEEPYHMVFSKNISNFMAITSAINMSEENKQNLVWLYLLIGIGAAGGMQYLISHRMRNGDVL